MPDIMDTPEYEEGYKAFFAGDEDFNCPYKSFSFEEVCWTYGFEDAKDDYGYDAPATGEPA
jgi:ribosome modulation factor